MIPQNVLTHQMQNIGGLIIKYPVMVYQKNALTTKRQVQIEKLAVFHLKVTANIMKSY